MGNNMQQVLMDSNQGCCTSWSSPQTSRLPEEGWTLLFLFLFVNNNQAKEIVALALQPCVSHLAGVRDESSGVFFQAWCWARPHSLPLWWAPLSRGMWPLWLWLPWFSAARPRAALGSTPLLASPVHRDRSTTTVSQGQCHLTGTHHFTLFFPFFFVMLDHRDICFRISTHSC